MALIIADRVQETSTTTGTGTLTLAGAVTGFRTFGSVMTNGDTIYYTITDQTQSANWEVGVGTWGTGGTLARTTILASSTGSAVNFTSGALYVFGTYPAGKAVYEDDNDRVSGYVIDNSSVGSVTPSTGTFTTLIGSSVGATQGTTGSANLGAFYYGALGYSDQNTLASFQSNVNSYNQIVIQNTSGLSAASADLTISNNLGTASTYYGNFGINSSGWGGVLGSTSLTSPNAVYLTGTSCDLVLGTTTSNSVRFVISSGSDAMTIDTGSRIGIGVTSPTASLHLKAGGAGVSSAPLKFTTGTNLSAVEAGAIEYDGEVFYSTPNTASGRGYAPSTQIFRLTANGGLITTIANFFGANSAINLAAGGEYEIQAFCYFLKTTAGTVTVTATTSLAPANLSGVIQTGAIAGGTAAGVAQQIALFNSTATGAAFAPTGSLTNGANHVMRIALIVEANASASNLRINFTSNAGSITPLRNSYYKVTRLPAGNSGSFAA